MITLNDYGWNKTHEVNWEEMNENNKQCVPGRVTLEHKKMYQASSPLKVSGYPFVQGQCNMKLLNGETFQLSAIGLQSRKCLEKNAELSIRFYNILFSRKVAGLTIAEQIIAVNIDIVFLVMSMNNDFNARRLERYLVAAYDSGATPVVVLTKKDVCDNPTFYIEEAQNIALGCRIFAVSNVTGEGIDELTALLKNNKTAALLGSSGVGKSSLMNAICGIEMMAVQDIREDDDKGRHTTTHRELVKIPTAGRSHRHTWYEGVSIMG